MYSNAYLRILFWAGYYHEWRGWIGCYKSDRVDPHLDNEDRSSVLSASFQDRTWVDPPTLVGCGTKLLKKKTGIELVRIFYNQLRSISL